MSVIAREPRSHRFDHYLFHRILDQWELTPLRITTTYVLFGVAALYFSDVFLVRQFSEPLLSQLQALKGGAEVVLTGVLIFSMTTAQEAQVKRSREKINRQREELLVLHRVLRHNLRNDLNIILGRAEFLTDSDLDTTVQNCGRTLLTTAEKMLHYTEQAARIRKVSAQNGHRVEKDLVQSVPRILQAHPSIDEGVQVNVESPNSAMVRVNHMFDEAIQELLTNAIKHCNRGEPRVEVAIDPDAGPRHLAELRISDNGSGIPDQVVSIIRESESDQLTHLQGMGLWFVYWVISESDGHLVIERNDDGGALVRARVPAVNFVTGGGLRA